MLMSFQTISSINYGETLALVVYILHITSLLIRLSVDLARVDL
jgi:hypothetical protein